MLSYILLNLNITEKYFLKECISMKILKIILRNFSAVKNAMNTNEVEIDFTNSTNKKSDKLDWIL